jgi:predicted Zn finger-like uncharacterized protein
MDIRCERCATEYEIEEAQIPEAGLTIKCATCSHIFKVLRGMAAPPPPLSLKLFRDGQTLSAICPDAATLQQWVVEQRILPTDEVSIGGQPWRRLGDVPEFSTFFALLSMPPTPAMQASQALTVGGFTPPPGATLTFQTPAPAGATSSMATVQRPTLQWQPPDPAGATAISQPKATPVPVAAPQDDNVRTIQIQLTPDMFPPARPGEAKRTTGATTPVAPVVPRPEATPRQEPAPTAAWPALPVNFGSEPLKLESLGGPQIPTASSTPRVTPAAKPPATKPATPSAKAGAGKTAPPAAKAKPTPKKPEVDPDLAEFMTGRGNGRLVAGLIAGVVVVGVGGYLAYPYVMGERGPSPAAKAAYEKGRKLYLTDTESQFMLAENAYKEAIGANPGTFPEAEGALAELHAAWGEQLLERYTAMQAEMAAMAAAGKDAKVLVPKVNELAANFKEKLSTVREEVNAARKNDANSVEADRALLDYYRLENDAGHAAQAAEALKMRTDTETLAHLAAWHAMDPRQAATAEAELKSAIEKEPEFVRARDWLAELHIRQNNTTAATKDMEAILKVAPQQERAMEYLDAQKSANAAVVANAPPANPPANAAPDAKAPEAPKTETPKAPEAPKTETARTESPKKTEPATKEDKEPVIASGDVDKLIDQAGRFLEKKKAAKALELYDRALKVKPALSDALYGRGLALYDLGRTDDAISAFKNTLDQNHKFGDAMIGIAEAYKREKKNKDAVKYYREYLDMYPSGEQAAVAKANVDALQ